MLDAIRRYVEAGREALTPKKAEELAKTLVKEGQARRERAGKVAKDLLKWSRENSERLLELVRGEVKKQIARAGLATKDELESVKRRIRKLESGEKATTKKRTASRKRASARSSKG